MGLEFYTASFPKARKQYKCDLCGETIEPGQQYSCFSGKYDGEMFTSRNCMICDRMIVTYCGDVGENEYDEDAIREWLSEKYCEDCPHGRNTADDCAHIETRCPHIRNRFEKREKPDETEN